MKAEIGFVLDHEKCLATDRMELRVTPQSSTEDSALQIFCKRMGWTYNPYNGYLSIEESVNPIAFGVDRTERK